MYGSLSFVEVFGLSPFPERLKQAAFAIRGDAYTPRSRFNLGSLLAGSPRLAFDAWLSHTRADRRAPIMNLFNHTPTPIEEGWSVRKRQMCDFRGGTLTYDSHNGTDFAIPPGTPVTTPAAGYVVRVSNEFHRGGLKIVIDHGGTLMTTSNHLGRVTVRVGDRLTRGQRIGLSGASGLDMVAGFPWISPHVHFNTWLNGEPVDPFARAGEVSIWRDHNSPTPCPASKVGDDEGLTRSAVSESEIAKALSMCRDDVARTELSRITDPYEAAMELVFRQNYYPTRFTTRVSPFAQKVARSGRLDMPFGCDSFVGSVLVDAVVPDAR